MSNFESDYWTLRPSLLQTHTHGFCFLFFPLLILNLLSFVQAQRRETYVWERYGKYDLSDPFLALQRDNEALRSSAQGRGNGTSCSQRRETDIKRSDPLTMVRLVVGQCRRMQEKMLKQLAAAESRHRRVSKMFGWLNGCINKPCIY